MKFVLKKIILSVTLLALPVATASADICNPGKTQSRPASSARPSFIALPPKLPEPKFERKTIPGGSTIDKKLSAKGSTLAQNPSPEIQPEPLLEPGEPPPVILASPDSAPRPYFKYLQNRDQDAPVEIAAAKALLPPKLDGGYKQLATLRKGVSGAKHLKDDLAYIELSEAILWLNPDNLTTYGKRDLGNAYLRTGAFHKAHELYQNWFPWAEFVNLKDYENMAIAAEKVEDYDAAILFLGCQLPKLTMKTKQAVKVNFDTFRLAAIHGDISKIELRIEDFTSYLESRRVKKQPLTRAQYFEKGAQVLRDAGYLELAPKMAVLADTKSVQKLKSRVKTADQLCARKDGPACLELGRIYAPESLFSTEAFNAFQQACTLGENDACIEEAVMHTYGIATPKDTARGHAIFLAVCDAGIGAGCHGAAMEFLGDKQEDMTRARQLQKRGCDLDFAKSCHSLASSYERPRYKGAEVDQKTALKYYEKSCKLNLHWSCGYAKSLRKKGVE